MEEDKGASSFELQRKELIESLRKKGITDEYVLGGYVGYSTGAFYEQEGCEQGL